MKKSKVMIRSQKLETIVKLFSSAMFSGGWLWETPNERVIEMLMGEVGYWPYKNEDEMVAKTLLDDELDKELSKRAIETIPTRSPSQPNLEHKSINNSIKVK